MKIATWPTIVFVACVSAGCGEKVTMPDADQGRAVADKFLELVRTGKAAQAWDETSAEFKSAEGKESFVRSVKKRPWLTKPSTFETLATIGQPPAERAEYVYRSADGKHQVRLLIASSAAGWCIDRIQVE